MIEIGLRLAVRGDDLGGAIYACHQHPGKENCQRKIISHKNIVSKAYKYT